MFYVFFYDMNFNKVVYVNSVLEMQCLQFVFVKVIKVYNFIMGGFKIELNYFKSELVMFCFLLLSYFMINYM